MARRRNPQFIAWRGRYGQRQQIALRLLDTQCESSEESYFYDERLSVPSPSAKLEDHPFVVCPPQYPPQLEAVPEDAPWLETCHQRKLLITSKPNDLQKAPGRTVFKARPDWASRHRLFSASSAGVRFCSERILNSCPRARRSVWKFA
jgi:hypothetical protein